MKIIKFKAKNNFELGQKLGAYFGARLRKLIASRKTQGLNTKHALKYLPPTEEAFPYLIEELKGYALAAKVDWEDLWTLGLEEDASGSTPPKEKCTSIINNGLVGHTEDWFTKNANDLFFVEKQIGDLKILEFFYFYTLGGNAFSVNSNGIILLTNSLATKDTQVGVPNHIIARWLSKTADPEKDFQKLKKIKRAGGENYIFINNKGDIHCLETSAKKECLFSPPQPFVHTNHYLSNLVAEEAYRSESSIMRFNVAKRLAPTITTVEDLKNVLSQPPIFRNNEKDLTIATAIVDLYKKVLHYRVNKEFGKISIDF